MGAELLALTTVALETAHTAGGELERPEVLANT